MRCIFLVLICLSLCGIALPDNRPDAPAPKVDLINIEHSPVEYPRIRPAHDFYNREARYTLVVEAAAWAGDMTTTCRNLSRNGREVGLPSQNCAAIIGMTFGFHLAAEGTAYLLHRLHWHPLERVPRWYLTSSSLYGIHYSLTHSSVPTH